MARQNICTASDSYKLTQYPQYPPGTTKIYSFFESRGGKWPETVFTGLLPILDKYFAGDRVSAVDVANADDLAALHFGRRGIFNVAGWRHIVSDHFGRLPLSIKAVPEGTVVPAHNVLMTVENTCPKCYWLTNYVETILVQAWYPITVATQSREIKRIVLKWLKKNGDPSLIGFKLHDFGFRGVSSVESARIGGAAHLVNFMGTDTLVALEHIAEHYGLPCAGFSIPASEHSTITSWGRDEEVKAFQNMIDKFGGWMFACVSDSFNIYDACTKLWGDQLKDRIINMDGTLVVRPDSGDPPEVVLEVLKRLGEAFGVVYNDKGYKLLHPKVRVIQGDGVNIDSIEKILRRMDSYGWSADNIAFGSGGALLQKLDRDTQKMALKASYIEGYRGGFMDLDDEHKWSRDVFKQPVTDPGKNSKAGRLKLVRKTGGGLYTQPTHLSPKEEDVLVEVFRDGEILRRDSFESIRERAAL